MSLINLSRTAVVRSRTRVAPYLNKGCVLDIKRSIGSQSHWHNRHSTDQGNPFTSKWQRSIGIGALASSALSIHYYLNSHKKIQLEASKDSPTVKAEEGDFQSDPTTGQTFPIILKNSTSSGSKEMKLIGLGVRTVTFLSVRVYVAGLYVDEKAYKAIQSLPHFKGFESSWMSNKEKDHSSEELLNALLDQGITCAIRIVPVRPTDYNHLKGGLTRAVQGRAKTAKKANLLSPQADEALSQSLQELNDAFPRATLPKGRTLDLIITPSSIKQGSLDLTLLEDGKAFGHVKGPLAAEDPFTVPRQLLLAYFADKDEISKPFKKSVAEGIEKITKGLE